MTMETRTHIITDIEYDDDDIAQELGLRGHMCRVRFAAGDFVATMAFDPEVSALQEGRRCPEYVVKDYLARRLTAQFRGEVERALGLRP